MSKIINLFKVPGDNVSAGSGSSVVTTDGPSRITSVTTGSGFERTTTNRVVSNGGGTNFLTTVRVGDVLVDSTGNFTAGTVASVQDDDNLTLTAIPSGAFSAILWKTQRTVNTSTSNITARLKSATTAKTVTKMKFHNDRSLRVITADGTGVCKLVASAPGAGEMNIIAADSAGNTYYVTRLSEHLAVVTRNAGSTHQFATGARVKWNEVGAVLNKSVKI